LTETDHPAAGSRNRIRYILLAAGFIFLLALYLPVLTRLVTQWLSDSNYRHGIVIPFISALILWRKRSELARAVPGGGDMTGFLCISAAVVLLIGGTAASELFTTRISLPLFLIGASLFLMGRSFTAQAAFPLLFLFMMIPLPYIIYYKISFPLQIMSARLSAAVLGALQVSVIRKGNIILLPNYALEVIAACSGLRSMMTMLTLALVLAFFLDVSKTRKAILVACAVPAAIGANTVRLTVTAIGAYAVSPEFADGALHQISGLIVFLAGFVLLVIVAGLLKWIR
jgi:exosortase